MLDKEIQRQPKLFEEYCRSQWRQKIQKGYSPLFFRFSFPLALHENPNLIHLVTCTQPKCGIQYMGLEYFRINLEPLDRSRRT